MITLLIKYQAAGGYVPIIKENTEKKNKQAKKWWQQLFPWV